MKRGWMLARVFGVALWVAAPSGTAGADASAAVMGPRFLHFAQDSLWIGDPQDLLDLRKLTKRIGLSPAQQDSAAQVLERVRVALKAFGWDYARLACEASIWGPDPPSAGALKARRLQVAEEVEGLLNPLRDALNESQKADLHWLMRGLGWMLIIPPRGGTPFICLDTRPIFDRVDDRRVVRPMALDGSASPDTSVAYRDLVAVWTTRAFLRGDEVPPHDVAAYRNWDVRGNMIPLQGRLIHSPLIAAATMLSPDLAESEVRHLLQYYNPERLSLDSLRVAYRAWNRVGERILIRLKLGTPYAAPFLARKNWLIYVEDDAGSAYEPVEEQVQAERPNEAIPVEIPGRTYEAVSHRPTPELDPNEDKHDTHFWADDSEQTAYAGHEVMLKLFFPVRRLDGTPVILPETQFLKLTIKPADGDDPGMVMTWEFRKPGR